MSKVSLQTKFLDKYNAQSMANIFRPLFITYNQMVDGYLFNYQSVTASTYTATVGDSFIKCDCTSNAIAVTLPDADQTKGKRYTIKKIDATANAVTVSATQTIDDAASQIISTQYDSIDIMSDGVEYWIV